MSVTAAPVDRVESAIIWDVHLCLLRDVWAVLVVRAWLTPIAFAFRQLLTVIRKADVVPAKSLTIQGAQL